MASFFGLVPELVTTVKVKSLSHVQLFATPWTIAFQVPPFMGFPRQECWSGLPFPSPEESSRPKDQTQVSCIAGRLFMVWATTESQPLWDMLQSNRCFWQNLEEGTKQGNMGKEILKRSVFINTKNMLLLHSRWITTDSLWPHELQHPRLFCPSLSPRLCSNSRPTNIYIYVRVYICSTYIYIYI